MALVVMRDHFAVLLEEIADYLRTLRLHLFKNDHNPTENDSLDDYVECDFSGYPTNGVPLSTWDTAFLNTALKGEIDQPNIIFTFGSSGLANQVYGYYLTDDLGYLAYAERNPGGPVYMSVPGQTFIVKLRMTLRNEPEV